MLLTSDKRQYSLSERIDALTKYTFSRPLLAAICIGSIIHLLKAASLWWFNGISYLAVLDRNLSQSTSFGLWEAAIPILVPFVVISYGRKISHHKQKTLLANFPDLNPDFVIKTDLAGNIEYLNPAAQQLVQTLKIPEKQMSQLLPDNFSEMISSAISNNKLKLGIEHHLENKIIDYTINCAPDLNTVFVAGRDISQRRLIERRLHDGQTIVREMSELVDQIFTDYDPLSFHLDEHFQQIVKTFLSPSYNTSSAAPRYVFLASRIRDELFSGHVYSIEDNADTANSERLEVDWRKHSGCGVKRQHAFFVNVEDSGHSLEEFQQQVDPALQKHVGTVHRFASYRSGEIAIIAFYEGDKVTEFDAMVLKTLAIYSNALLRISQENKATEEAFEYVVDALARASEINDEDTGAHIIRINEYSLVLARELGQSDNFLSAIHFSAQMHDVGKIHTPAHILKKPGILTNEEFRIMQQHTLAGARILGSSPRLTMAAEIAKYHHEKFDGSGYPCGLKGDEIPLAARIVAIADVYDALRQKRVYKDAMTHNEAIHTICEGDERTRPSHFDPEVLEAFLRIQDQFDAIFSRYHD